ncbi:UNVERIFIED_ORG: hypothetical protein J2W38_006259 [Variovorax paradoxus]|nr:hypothetical protein [Variovorax paradoxus]
MNRCACARSPEESKTAEQTQRVRFSGAQSGKRLGFVVHKPIRGDLPPGLNWAPTYVYRVTVVADLLAQPEGEWKPFNRGELGLLVYPNRDV